LGFLSAGPMSVLVIIGKIIGIAIWPYFGPKVGPVLGWILSAWVKDPNQSTFFRRPFPKQPTKGKCRDFLR
jgi:hypothetical protein